MDIREIVQQAGMSDRPAYYSGRGATLSDLNNGILQRIYDGIKEEFGDAAAKEYVQLVDELEVMSATSFLNSLYALAHNNWQFDHRLISKSGVDMDSEGSAWGTLLSGLTRGDRDDSYQIKNVFLATQGIIAKSRREYVDKYGVGYRYR